MATTLSLIVDDGLNAYNANVTDTVSQSLLYKQTAWQASRGASFVFSFKGSSIAFIGFLGPNSLQTLQIDNGTVTRVTYDDRTQWPAKSAYGQWFQSPMLSEGDHTINVTSVDGGTTIDFAVVNVGNQTHLAGKTVIVDNDSPSIFYSGHWNRNTSQFNSNIFWSKPGYPYGNSTHRSSTPGDTFTFRFTGTSVSVYGLFSPTNLGSLGVTYAIDGTTISDKTIDVTSADEVGDGPGDECNYLYFHLDELPAVDHTLVVNITVARHLTFMLDYITYKPSFDKLLSMPILTSTTTTTTSSVPINSSTSTPQVQNSGTSQRPTVAIVGGVVGALALAAILGAWLFLERRKARQTEIISHYQDDANSLQHMSHHRPQPVKFNSAMQAAASHIPPSLHPPPNNDNPAAEIPSPPPYNTPSQVRPLAQYIIAI